MGEGARVIARSLHRETVARRGGDARRNGMLRRMPRPILATIDLAAMRHNLARARASAGGRFVWAVIKANAYGHGIERAVRAFADADGLALLDLAEARRARDAGWRKPILLLEGFFEASDLDVVRALELTAVLHDHEQVRMLAADRHAGALSVYVKLNTGMNRLGFDVGALPGVLATLRADPRMRVAALMTHFSNGEGGGRAGIDDVAAQMRRFDSALAAWNGPWCVANSAALLLQPQVGGDAVRPGILLYGGTPAAGTPAARLDLRPAMRLTARLLAVRELDTGASVGYGGRWVATRPSRIGVVAAGYADGYPRIAPNGTPVWVDGRTVPLAGRVSMDMLTVDLTDAPGVRVGAPVELWGEHVPIDTVAELSGTVGYELMCALAQRVPVAEVG
jgi:alanine racemase